MTANVQAARHLWLLGLLALMAASSAEPKPTLAGALSGACAAALQEAGVVAHAAADFAEAGACTMEEPVGVSAIETRMGRVTLPTHPVVECRLAAMLGAWIGEVVGPVTAALLGSPVNAMATGPGYQCRSRSAGGKLSQHATGNAIDVLGLELLDGRSVAIGRVPEGGAERVLLGAVSTSACGYFTTVLGPGSDPAHADHLHLDMAERDIPQYRICMPR